ncbi:MAG: sulfatase [Candidatus Diapherotrites archaeon]|uniref:Sulfatase n=1 Tax=Candidatus Iainarchaeum sp. TaxID=3101447 RepID=A0A8T4C7Y2_9ARCH|nr:sulfatase [Candidatus Diapherotrites archaeon]
MNPRVKILTHIGEVFSMISTLQRFSLSRVIFLAILVLGVLVIFSQLSLGVSPALKPNVIVIQLDDLAYSDLFMKRPNGDYVLKNIHTQLVRRGTSFENHHTSFSLCCPARATLFTGQYAHNHGVLSNDPPTGGFLKLNHTNTLPIWLQQAGYYTSHVGKYMNGYNGGTSTNGISAPRPPGWDDWFTTVRIGGYPQGSYYNHQIHDNDTFLFFGNTPADYLTDVLANRAVAVIAQRGNDPQPFYLQVDFFSPHGEPTFAIPAQRHIGLMNGMTAPRTPAFNEADVSDKPADVRGRPLLTPSDITNVDLRYQKRGESLLAVDEAVGRMIRVLRHTGQYDNTVIIFTSDNGWMQGEHRLPIGKNFTYTASTQAPLIIAGPRVPRTQRVSQLTGNIDVTPTILEITGASPGLVQDGHSLFPLMRGQTDAVREELLLESPIQKFYAGLRTEDTATGEEHLYIEYDYNLDGQWDEREMYAITPDSCQPVGDPFLLESQHTNPCYAVKMAQMSARVAYLKTCSGPTC